MRLENPPRNAAKKLMIHSFQGFQLGPRERRNSEEGKTGIERQKQHRINKPAFG